MARTRKNISKKVEVETKLTDEDLILGKKVRKEVKTVISYEDESITYMVTNLKINNKPTKVTGDLIETFIGSNNIEARNALKDGAKCVITKDFKHNDEYKIEVVE